jgi:hypothetical protein
MVATEVKVCGQEDCLRGALEHSESIDTCTQKHGNKTIGLSAAPLLEVCAPIAACCLSLSVDLAVGRFVAQVMRPSSEGTIRSLATGAKRRHSDRPAY